MLAVQDQYVDRSSFVHKMFRIPTTEGNRIVFERSKSLKRATHIKKANEHFYGNSPTMKKCALIIMI